MVAHQRSLELFYIDGRPDGLLTAQLYGWTGHVLVVPRLKMTAALARPEAAYAGVYILLGEQEDGQPCAYIGKAEKLCSRLNGHKHSKLWWDKALLVSTVGNQLHKGYITYLEASLIERAHRIQHTVLTNKQFPSPTGLCKSDRAKMEEFLENLFLILPALRVDMFTEHTRSNQPKKENLLQVDSYHSPSTPRFELTYPKHHIRATAVFQEGEFVVEEGSEASLQWKGSKSSSYSQRHDELLRSGVLKRQGEKAVFTSNYACSSLSEAAALVYGRSASGPREWRFLPTRERYYEWEQKGLEEELPSVYACQKRDPAVRFELTYPKYHIHATAVLQDGDFVVEAGSEAYPQWKGDKNSSYSYRHEELSRNGVLKQDGQKAIFATDYVCSSTSEAAAIVKGRSAAGPTSWRLVGTHISYKEWEAQRLEEDAVSVASPE